MKWNMSFTNTLNNKGQITSPTIVYWTVYSGADEKINKKSSASLAFVRGIHRWPVNSPHKGPVTRKKFPFDDVIMWYLRYTYKGLNNQRLWLYHEIIIRIIML